MVKAAEKGSRCDRAESLDDAVDRSILDQGSVGSQLVVVACIGRQDAAQVRLAEDHDVVQAISPDRADEAFDVPILPRRSGRRWSVPNAHRSKTARNGKAI